MILEDLGSIATTAFIEDVDAIAIIIFPQFGRVGIVNGLTNFFDIDVIGAGFGLGGDAHQAGTAVESSFLADLVQHCVPLPAKYVSQTEFSGSARLTGRSLADLGATPGVYIYETLFEDAVTNTITLTVGAPPPPIPLPATLQMLAAGLGGLALWRRRRG